MKKILASLLLLISSITYAAGQSKDSLELVGPGLTWHVIDGGASYLYSNKVSSDGRLIYTPMLGLKKTHVSPDWSYHSFTLFTAQNSIGSPIYGGVGGMGVELFNMLDMGVAIGGYIQNNEDFRYKGVVPYSLTGGENAFVPILGFEINAHYYVSQSWFIGFNNLITPVITNHNLSVGFSY